MKRAAALWLLTVVALALPIVGPFYIFPTVVPVLAPVLPRPNFVPRDAKASYEWKASGMHWRWRRTLAHGCAKWSATERYAQVTLSLDPPGCGRGGVSYLTFEDELVFKSGEPAPGREPVSGGGAPCPFIVSDATIAELRQVADEGLARRTTSGERSVLRRIRHRLDLADGAKLTSYTNGAGCGDATAEDYTKPRSRFDPLGEFG